MKRRIALLLVICLLTSMVPAATAGGAAGDGILDNEIEIVDVGEQDITGPSESDGIELEADDFLDEPGDILPEGDMPELELGDALDLPEGEALLPESETQGDASEANDDSSDFIIADGVLIKYNGAGGDVVIPDGVTAIGDEAFYEQPILSITIPNSVKRIGRNAFGNCWTLKSIVIPDSVTEINEMAFNSCTALKEIAIPGGLTRIADSMFIYCSALTTVQIPDSVTEIGNKAFEQCGELSDVHFSNGLTSIGYGAFNGCSKLSSVTLPDSLKSIGEYAFYSSGLTAVTIPKNVTVINESTFLSCRNLTEVVIPNGVTHIKAYAFWGCQKLQKVTIPDSVVRIGQEAFEYCSSLEEAIIPRSVTKISMLAFDKCEKLTIKGFTGSAAEKYANENGIPFVAIDAPTPEISVPKALTLGVKETYALDATGASFKSSNTAVAAVDKKGVVTAKKAGSATVTVTVGGKKAGTCKVTVVKAPTEVSFAEKSVTLGVKETLALKPTITKGSHASYTWSVKDKKIATVDKDGVVTGKKAGKTTVTVKTHNGLKATVTVTVQKAPTKVSLPKKAVTLGVKEALTLTPKIAKGAHTSFTWTVADSKIATVTKSGKITGKKAGKTTVTVKTHNGKKATVTVTVMKAPTAVSLEAKTMALGVKESVKLKPSIASDAHTSYTWTVKNKKIATVSADGKLTGVKAGKTTVTVKTHNGKKATMTVNVMAAPGSITLSGKSRKLTVGDAIMLMPTLPRKTASRITWSSSKKSVASVDASGVVRALKKGTVKITAKTFNGKKAVCTVKVGEGASYLAFDVDALSVGVKEKVTLKPQVNEGAKVKYSWTTGNKKVATVSQKGVVTGVKAGSTDITVKTQNGLTATVKVTVLAAPSKVTLNKGKATLPENQTLQLKATLPNKTASQIKWSTSDKKVATVDETGLVTAVAVGKATITAQTFNGKKATCVVTVREADSADRFEAIYDSYESSQDSDHNFLPATLPLLSTNGFEDSQDIVSIIEEYNGLAQTVNDNNEAYTACMDRVLESLDSLFDTAGKTSVVASEDSLKIEIGGMRIESSIDSTQVASNGGMSREESYLANVRVYYQSNDKNIQSLYKETKEVRAWCDRISNAGNAAKILIQEADFYADAQHKAAELAEKAAKKAYDLAREKGLTTEKIAPLLKNIEKAAENVKLWKGVCDSVKWLSKKVGSLIVAANEASVALGLDLAKLTQIDMIADHGHPIEREEYDKVQNKYVRQMDESIESAKKAIKVDIGVNVGLVTVELAFAKAKIAAVGALSKFAIGRKLLEKIEKLTKFIGEKWLKRSWLGTNIGATMAAGENVDKHIEEIEHCDDILHGAVKGKVSGVIVDGDTKTPIEGVCVEGDNTTTYSNADGSYSISLKYGMYDESYALKFTKEGYIDATAIAEVDEGSDDVNVPLEMFTAGIPIDWEHFPDEIFRGVMTTFDLNNNGYLSDEENNQIKSLEIKNKGISSLEGVRYLIALEELSCANNKLTSLNVSEMPSLKSVNCAWNQLESLNVSQCTGLEQLDCQNNELVNLNVSWCKSLKELVCAFNKLATLNVSGCVSIERLICDDNNLISLDLSGCTKLKELNCNALQTKAGKLANLILKECHSLETLDCRWNQLKSLDVTQCEALQKLDCSYNQLNGLKLENCSYLAELNCGGNQLTSLNVGDCAALEVLNCAVNKLTGLDVSGMAKLTDLNCGDNQLTSLNVDGCAALRVLNCEVNKLKTIDISTCAGLQELYCTSNQIEVLNKLDIRKLKVAQYDDGTRLAVLYGRYEQDDDTSNGAEPIEWIVLQDRGNTLTLISRYCLFSSWYGYWENTITWQNCELRAELNGTFLSSAFTSAEQAKLQTVTVRAEDNPRYGTEAGNDTQDKVYLLSISEAEKLFANDEARKCRPTAYASKHYLNTHAWWLRSPGHLPGDASYVTSDGSVCYTSDGPSSWRGVRPVVCLRLS